MSVTFIDNSEEIKAAMHEALLRALVKIGMTAEKYARRLCPVDSTNLRTHITHQVDEAELAVYIGTNIEYAPYVELGTGIYYPGGRTTPWGYQDEKGNWHRTSGCKAQPFLKPAATEYMEEYL